MLTFGKNSQRFESEPKSRLTNFGKKVKFLTICMQACTNLSLIASYFRGSYSKTSIYRQVWNKATFVVKPISRLAVDRSAVNETRVGHFMKHKASYMFVVDLLTACINYEIGVKM